MHALVPRNPSASAFCLLVAASLFATPVLAQSPDITPACSIAERCEFMPAALNEASAAVLCEALARPPGEALPHEPWDGVAVPENWDHVVGAFGLTEREQAALLDDGLLVLERHPEEFENWWLVGE